MKIDGVDRNQANLVFEKISAHNKNGLYVAMLPYYTGISIYDDR